MTALLCPPVINLLVLIWLQCSHSPRSLLFFDPCFLLECHHLEYPSSCHVVHMCSTCDRCSNNVYNQHTSFRFLRFSS
jgi:hypothetical protein